MGAKPTFQWTTNYSPYVLNKTDVAASGEAFSFYGGLRTLNSSTVRVTLIPGNVICPMVEDTGRCKNENSIKDCITYVNAVCILPAVVAGYYNLTITSGNAYLGEYGKAVFVGDASLYTSKLVVSFPALFFFA